MHGTTNIKSEFHGWNIVSCEAPLYLGQSVTYPCLLLMSLLIVADVDGQKLKASVCRFWCLEMQHCTDWAQCSHLTLATASGLLAGPTGAKLKPQKKLPERYIWSIALYGSETGTLRAVDQKHLESFEMWCWRKMENISWTDRVRSEVLLRVKEQRNILHTIKWRKVNWIGHIWCRNWVLKQFIEGKKIEVTGRRRRRSKQLLNDFKERRGYCKLKEEALDRTLCRSWFGRICGPDVRRTDEWMNDQYRNLDPNTVYTFYNFN